MLQEFNLGESYIPTVGFLKCNFEWLNEDILGNKKVRKEKFKKLLVFLSIIVIKTYTNPC